MTSTPADVDRSAPVLAHHEIDIAAPLDTVWDVHTDVNGFAVTSTIYDVDPRSRILWGGTAGGITGVHEWRFTETPSGTHVETNESFAGVPVEADIAGMQSLLDGSLVPKQVDV